MGGLTTALALAKEGFKHIDVYESASNLGFVGAGIQLAPNMARVLDNLGVWKQIEAEAVNITETSVRVGASDSELAHVPLEYIHDTYGYPHMVGHRSSLAGGLYDGCLKHAEQIHFHFSTTADKVTFGPKPSFTATPRDASQAPYTVEADVLLGCDGIKSNTRVAMLELLNIQAHVKDTHQAAYRIMIHRDQIKDDPELLALMEGNKVTRWIGEKRHIIAYPVSNNTIYNLSTTQPDSNFAAATNATYTTRGDKSVMLGVFADFCPMVQRMLATVPEGEVCEWKLRVHEPLPTWVHESVALVGDACHPTLPHLAQGAAQAIEDGGVLGAVLAQLPDTTPASINKALKVYEKIRKNRAYALVELAAASGRALHLGDGAAKEERDRQFAALKEGKGPVPDKWADADVQRELYGVDTTAIAREKFQELFAEVTV
ncbi:FAD/NAD(P)-binding domain-containing protein [Aspergillus heteromorphus CBS 117.55]|uniref:FAD/NAD(P)-binding domain-containing protein n=1 Tax=Aspergillus heteromorphus CBS 117.55 TaxID=1448321 RepID=A0A317WY89_9EURO|nr:FAD/NAD(P)-binding domain-containing protein [Aspergillus heteromorphus CBS 117.55]PWY90945.1 FAD/NAD(P)-binding domain-containing protein [Aspergillus heteromorphus CBS 117.55]